MKGLAQSPDGESLSTMPAALSAPMAAVIRAIINRHNTPLMPMAASYSSSSPIINPAPLWQPTLFGQLEAQRIILSHQLYLTLLTQGSPLAVMFSALQGAQCTEQAILYNANRVRPTAPITSTSTTSTTPTAEEKQLPPHVHMAHFAPGVGEPVAPSSATRTVSTCATAIAIADEVANSSALAAADVRVHPPAQAASHAATSLLRVWDS